MAATARRAQNQDFGIERLRNLLTSSNAVIRHDVDFVPWCAVAMTVLERKLGVVSTFYVRPLGCYQDPVEALKCFQEIVELGGELAPHVDLFLDRAADAPDGYLRLCCESDFLSLSLDLPVVRKVSFHAPPTKALWRAVEGFEHAMGPEWSGRYIGDSRGMWQRSPESLLRTATGRRPVQVNLHPEWYFLSPYDRAILQHREISAP